MSPRLVQCSTKKNCINLISGHSWTEETLINKWELHTNVGVIQTFSNHEKALKALAEWEAYKDKFPFICPQSQRESNKAVALGLPSNF